MLRHTASSSSAPLASTTEPNVPKRDIAHNRRCFSPASSSIYSQPSGSSIEAVPTRRPPPPLDTTKQEPIKSPLSYRPLPISSKGNSDMESEPSRQVSFRPREIPRAQPLSDREAEKLSDKLCSRVWKTDLGRMWDNAVAADKKGNVDDELYSQLLDFFYCYLPVCLLCDPYLELRIKASRSSNQVTHLLTSQQMVLKAPAQDPVIVSKEQLQQYRILMTTYVESSWTQEKRGKNTPHLWFSRPGSETFLQKVAISAASSVHSIVSYSIRA